MFKAIYAFIGWALWNKLVATITGAALGALIGFAWEDIDARVRHWVQPGNMGGTYVIKSSAHGADLRQQVPTVYSVTLKHGGNRVFGVMESRRGKRWYFNGHLRNEFMSLAYGGLEEDGLGTGTYSMQKDIADILWGHVTQVECIGRDAFYTRCPAVMYRAGREDSQKAYTDFMAGPCEKVIIKAPDSREDLKAKTVSNLPL